MSRYLDKRYMQDVHKRLQVAQDAMRKGQMMDQAQLVSLQNNRES